MNTHGPEYAQWLASLKVGDSWKAIKPGRWSCGQIVTFTITGETNKQWKVGADPYWKNSGRLVGSGSYVADLLPPATESALSELRAEIKTQNLRHKLAHKTDWQSVGMEVLVKIEEILSGENP